MATSGQINTNTTYDSYFWVKWSQDHQGIASNHTTIFWECGVYCGHNFYSNAIKMSAITINGVQVYGGGKYSNFYVGEHQIAYGYLDIYHDSDGNKTFSISPFTGWLYENNNYSSNGGNFDFEPIPRQATLTSSPDFTDLDNPTIEYSNPAGNAVDSLQACISLTQATDDIKYRDIDKTGTSYKFNLTEEERALLRENTTSGSRKVFFFVRTKIGSNTFYSADDGKTLSIVENDSTKPSLHMSISLNNGSLPSTFNGLYIQGKSKVDVELSAEGKYKATINSYSTTLDGKTYNSNKFTTDVVQTPGDVKIVGSVVDSRKFTNSEEYQISVIPYSKPLVIPIGSENAILCYRSDGNGVRVGNSTSVWIKAKRDYRTVTSNGVQKNFCALQWRKKLVNDAWDDGNEEHKWRDLIPKTNITTTEYNASLSNEVFELTKSYTVQVRATDDIGETDIKTFEIPTQDVALHLGHGGKNVAVGTYCDYSKDYTFYSEWDAYFDKDVYIKGNPISNHVIEEGSQECAVRDGNGNQIAKGTWSYRKWSNGCAECRGVFVQNDVAVNYPWGVGLFESKGYVVDLPSGLFVETPQFTITLDASGGTFLQTYSLGSTLKTPHMCAVRPEETTTIAILNTSISAYGRWK